MMLLNQLPGVCEFFALYSERYRNERLGLDKGTRSGSQKKEASSFSSCDMFVLGTFDRVSRNPTTPRKCVALSQDLATCCFFTRFSSPNRSRGVMM